MQTNPGCRASAQQGVHALCHLSNRSCKTCRGNGIKNSQIHLLEQFLDIRSDRVGLGSGRVALDHLALLVDEELGEVPLNAFKAEESGLLVLQELEDLVRVGAVNVRLRHDREAHAVVDHTEVRDTIVILRLLLGELVARETKDDKAPVFIVLVELFKAL